MGETEIDRSREVRLTVPALPEYLRLVRLTAAGLASRMGFTFDEVEDLRIAVDELCHLLIGDGDSSRVMELRYSSADEVVSIEGFAKHPGAPPRPNELSQQILSALVDEHEIVGADGEVRFRLLKYRQGD